MRRYCRYGVSYRNWEDMLGERGVEVDHSTIYRWVQRYAPKMEKRLRWYWKRLSAWRSWRVDDTYVKPERRAALERRRIVLHYPASFAALPLCRS